MRRARVAIAAALVVLSLTACAGDPVDEAPTGLTSEQAERLAVTRFRNFDAGVRTIEVTVPTTEVGEISLSGWFDFAQGVGYASVKNGGTVWWSADTVAFRDVPSPEAELPLPPDQWVSYPLDPSSNPLAAALALVAELGFDRPDNPQLLAQSDAALLRPDTVDGVDVDVFIGPSSSAAAESSATDTRARYWIDDTGLMLRFEAPKGAAVTTVDFGSAGAIALPSTVPGTP